MRVIDLIEELKKFPPEMEVMIQQGEEYDYMKAYTVKQIGLSDPYIDDDDDNDFEAVVIEYS